MPHTLFGTLRHRYGTPRPVLAENRAAARAAQARFAAPRLTRELLPNGLSATVIGAGFAGLTAATYLRSDGIDVTVLEAQDHVGGRVQSSTFIPGRIIEVGAELIGANHPTWLKMSKFYGLGLSVLTSEEEFDAAYLTMPLYLNGQLLDADAAERVYRGMDYVFGLISEDASKIADPEQPWDYAHALDWDNRSVADVLKSFGVAPGSLLWRAISLELECNQTIPITDQSYLGLCAVVRGGQLGTDKMAFWTQSEVYRCEAGNQQLAIEMERALNELKAGTVRLSCPARSVTITDGGVTVSTEAGEVLKSDYVVLAVPQAVWGQLKFDPVIPPGYLISAGPAVKYLSQVASRFWLASGQAPSGMSDRLGMTWEGTDNQMGSQGIELSVFAGGDLAQAAMDAPDKVKYFTNALQEILPAYPKQALTRRMFANWPSTDWIRCGYSCPALGQVTTAGKALASLYEGRMAFAGEHTIMSMFGYMEGALQSGYRAAERLKLAAGL